jgi:hypothetical protein
MVVWPYIIKKDTMVVVSVHVEIYVRKKKGVYSMYIL